MTFIGPPRASTTVTVFPPSRRSYPPCRSLIFSSRFFSLCVLFLRVGCSRSRSIGPLPITHFLWPTVVPPLFGPREKTSLGCRCSFAPVFCLAYNLFSRPSPPHHLFFFRGVVSDTSSEALFFDDSPNGPRKLDEVSSASLRGHLFDIILARMPSYLLDWKFSDSAPFSQV